MVQAEIFEILVTLYLLGRKLKKASKQHNNDLILNMIILSILQKQPLTVTELAAVIATQTSSISEKLLKLEVDGYVEKIDSTDLRTKKMSVTPVGMEYYRQLLIQTEGRASKYFTHLTSDEKVSLLAILKKALSKEE